MFIFGTGSLLSSLRGAEMKVLLIYDTVSEARMTEKVAGAVAAGMKEAGASVDSFFVGEASKAEVTSYDCLVLGAPTMAWRPSKRMKEYIAGLNGDFKGKKAASFDTQFDSGFAGNATKHMDKSLAKLGFSVESPSLVAFVESENKLYKMGEGELERAKGWGRTLAANMAK
jgi:flavodoxin